MRLLIVDDEPSILELLSVALKALGTYKIKTARSAKQALEMIEGKPREFDAFLLDIQMPEMNGIELCRAIRASDLYKSAPILMLTAMSQMSYVEKAFDAGATDYVTKPFDFENLKQRLNAARKLKYSKAPASATEANPAMMRSVFFHEKHDYTTGLDFSQVERFIGASEFENYVQQMSRSKATHTCAFAVRVTNGAAINASVSSMDFYNAIFKVAEQLSKATKVNGSLLTYKGNGIFLCAEYGSRKTNTSALARKIATAMAADAFSHPRPETVVGDHAEMSAFTETSGGDLLQAAIEKSENLDPIVIDPAPVEIAEAPLPRTAPALRARPSAQPPQPDAPRAQRRPDRKAYEKMLLDSLRNG
ncbi:response regulator [Pseudooceanicola sp.]|uniref:response regulator transcription factor n=1 Tax=Pseudooceanicola sp. TaxID=1914328 RepID=UPI00263359A3|nr:response regulator [Pseudooceanicola sp.]MDF1853977.1 response regulator [Pseudooceanicola sp.]